MKKFTFFLCFISGLILLPYTSFAEEHTVIDEDFESGKSQNISTVSAGKGTIVKNDDGQKSKQYFSSSSKAENTYILINTPFKAKGAKLSFDYRIDTEKYPDAYLAISPKTSDGRVYPFTAVLAPETGKWVHWEGVLDDLQPKIVDKKVARILLRSRRIDKAKNAKHTLSIDNIKLTTDDTYSNLRNTDLRTNIPDFLEQAKKTRWPTDVEPSKGDFTLVEKGKPIVEIVTNTNNKELLHAAKELADHIEMISGAKMNIVPKSDKPAFHLKIDKSLQREEHKLNVSPQNAELIGSNSWAVELGVYELLRRLGVHWYMPGKLGLVFVKSNTVRLPSGEYRWKPRFSIRDQVGPFFNDKVMEPNARAEVKTWHRRLGATNSQVMTNHNYFHVFPKNELEKHPEYYAIVDGKPSAEQIRTTSPEVIRIMSDAALKNFKNKPGLRAYSLMPNDNPHWDERPEALKLDNPTVKPWIYGWPLTDTGPRLLTFMNAVANIVVEKYPSKWIFSYVKYHRHQQPKEGQKAHPNLLIGLILHDRNCCRPINCFEDKYNAYEIESYNKWLDIAPRTLIRTYLPPYRLSGIPFRRARSDIHDTELLLKPAKMLGMKNERCVENWSCYLPDPWTRSIWILHPKLSADEILDSFYSNFYGPAKEPMKAYHELSEWSIMNSNQMIKPGGWGLRKVRKLYPPTVIRQMRNYLKLAREKVKDEENPVYRDRIKFISYGQEYLEKAIETVSMLDDDNPLKALHVMDEMRNITRRGWKFNCHAFHYAKNNYVDGSFAAEYRRIKKLAELINNLKIIKPLNSGWVFCSDSDNKGTQEKWFKNDYDCSSWHKINVGDYWENQGYQNLDGNGWYKLEFIADNAWKNKNPVLMFCGIDDSGTIYLNGKKVKDLPFQINPPSWKTPCRIPLTENNVKFGEKNQLVVRVNDKSGHGGLYLPVYIIEGE